MKVSYKYKIFFYFLLIFAAFVTVLVVFEQKNEAAEKRKSLEKVLNVNTDIIHVYIQQNQLDKENIAALSALVPLLEKQMRITVIDKSGSVIYDNDIENLQTVENHLNRPEIYKSLMADFGSDIRQSATLNRPFCYFAKMFDNQYFIRVALPYDSETKKILKADNLFIYFALSAFLVGLLLLNLVSNRFAKSISQLRDFARSAKNNENLPQNIYFQDDELGEIGQEIQLIFEKSQKNQQLLALQTEKLIEHLQYSQEGLCLFTDKREKIYANSHFIQYRNFISDKPTFNVSEIFTDPAFAEIQKFLEKPQSKSVFTTTIHKNSKIFSVQALVFEDKSFEISIRDVSEQEKRRQMKQELTSSIAHELRTPVTSLRAYLETLNGQTDMPQNLQRQFISRSYSQTLRLSELIDDIALITKIEEAANRFPVDDINISTLLEELRTDLEYRLERKSPL
jgi:two-component system OmpR family sensor kinase/two-component system phosphate regulon sensor histidine kinase PhoR